MAWSSASPAPHSASMPPGYTKVLKYGANLDVTTAETVWTPGGLYPWATWTGGNSITVESTDAGDTSISVTIEGLDANGAVQTVTTATNASNGTTAVAVTGTWDRVYRAYLSGSNQTAAGAINIKISTTIVAQIAAGKGQTQMAVYTVPAGKVAYISLVDSSVSNSGGSSSGAQIEVFFRPSGGSWRMLEQLFPRDGDAHRKWANGSIESGQRLDALTDIDVRANQLGSPAGDVYVGVSFNIFLRDV